ncbi:MAG: hypothetical protein ACREKH_01525, partial [Candidatus Rokuibacteriota bacterium]
MSPSRIRALSLLTLVLAIAPCPGGVAAASPPSDQAVPAGLVIVIPDAAGRSVAAAQDALLAELASTAPIELLRNPHDGSLLLHVTADGRSALTAAAGVAGVFDGVED